MLALLQDPLRLLLMLFVFPSLEQLGFLLLESVLLQLVDHFETIADLLFILLLEVDNSMNVDWFVLEVPMLFVIRHHLVFVLALTVPERSQVFD